MIYDNLKKNKNNIIQLENKLILHFVRGPYAEIKGNKSAEYKIEFINNKTGEVLYQSTINNNCWCKCNFEYFIEWKVKVYENGKLWNEHLFNAENKRIYVALDSKALGDSLAWFPYVEEFRKKHKCKMIVSTFMNDMFKEQYPEIEFVNPGNNVDNLYSMYAIGLFYDDDGKVNLLKNQS